MTVTLTPFPGTPPQTSDPVNFDPRADATMAWLPTFATEVSALSADLTAQAAQVAADAVQTAIDAANAASAANVTKWLSGTTYTVGNVVWSPATFLTYRRKTNGAGTTDPSADNTNWKIIVGERPMINKTILSAPAAFIKIDNILTTDYDNYEVMLNNITMSADDRINFQFVNAGAVISTGSLYYVNGTFMVTGTSSVSAFSLSAVDRFLVHPTNNADAASKSSATIRISNINSGGDKQAKADAEYRAGSSSAESITSTSQLNFRGGTVTGIYLYLEGGSNFVTTEVRVYGITK